MDIGVVGIGRWGKHLLRNFNSLARVPVCCHRGSRSNREWLDRHYPDVSVTTDYEAMLGDETLDAIAIATPIETHAELTRRAVEADKHVFVEKPLATSAAEASNLVELVEESGMVLFVGYIFIYHPLVRQLKAIHRETPVRRLRFAWEKFGAFDESLLLDLACHPLSLCYHFFEDQPTSVDVFSTLSATSVPDTVTLAATFTQGRHCEISINRLSGAEAKSMTAVTTDGVYAWTELELARFDPESRALKTVATRETEPLRVECQRFVDAVAEESTTHRTDGQFALAVNEMIESVSDAW